MKNKSTRLSRWKAAMCVAALSAAAASAQAQVVSGGSYAGPVVSPTSLNFGMVPVGSTSAVQTLTLSVAYGGGTFSGPTPEGGPAFAINSLVFPTGFARSGGTCPASGAASSPCTVGVVFQPVAIGVNSNYASLTAATGGLPGTTTVPVTGTGVETTSVPFLGNLSLLLLLAGLGGAGLIYARRH